MSTDDRFYLPEATVYFKQENFFGTMSSYETLFQCFEIIHQVTEQRREGDNIANANAADVVADAHIHDSPDATNTSSNLSNAVYLIFTDWDLKEIPPNLGRVMTHINQCTFVNCRNLSSLSSVVAQFPNICVLVCRQCPSLTSLSSFQSIPLNSSLYNIAFKECGLQVTEYDDWGEGFRGLARTNSDKCIMTIQNCPDLTCLPSSIEALKDKELTMNFRSNRGLWRLPLELGNIKKITGLSIIQCPQLQELPWSLSRLPDCSLFIAGSESLLGGISMIMMGSASSRNSNSSSSSSNMDLTKNGVFGSIRDHRVYFVHQMQRCFIRVVYLKLFFRRWIKDVMERMYEPGGRGYHQSKQRFEQQMAGATIMIRLNETIGTRSD